MSIGTLAIPSLPITGGRRPALDLSFLSGVSFSERGLGGSGLDPRITFTRASDATMVGPDGLVRRAPHNRAIQSQNVSLWTSGGGISFNANEVTAPDGTLTGTRVTMGTDGSAPGPNGQSVIIEGVHVFSGYVRIGATVPFLRIRIGTSAGSTSAWINLSTMAFGTLGAGFSNGSVVQVNDEWYRFSVLYTSNATDAGNRNPSYCGVIADNSSTASTGNYFWIWGIQIEANITPSYYVRNDSNISGTITFDQPRFEYDPITLAAKGLLLEEQRTNICLYSEQFDNAAWAKGVTATVTANAGTAPDGTNTADSISFSAAAASSDIAQRPTTVAGTTYTSSIYLKVPSGTGAISLRNVNNVGADISSFTTCNLTTEWQRFSRTDVFPDTASGMRLRTDNTYLGPVLVWGAQIEVGAFATSYIPTTGSSATRSTDVASMTGSNVTSWFNSFSPEITWAVEAMQATSGGTGFPHLVQLNDGSNVNRLSYYLGQNSNLYAWFIRQSGVTTAEGTLAPGLVIGNVYSLATAIKGTVAVFARNGIIVGTDTSTGMPSNLSRVDFRDFAGTPFNGYIRKVRYWKDALSNPQLAAATKL